MHAEPTFGIAGILKAFCINGNLIHNSGLNCCQISNSACRTRGWLEAYRIPRPFYAFGTSNVSVKHHWITEAKYHYPTDVGLVISKPVNITSPDFEVNVCYREDACMGMLKRTGLRKPQD